MKCWSCESPMPPDARGQPFCPSCGKIAARAPNATLFDVFGLSPRYEVDVPALEKQFRDLSLKLHPDRFAKAEAKERRLSLEQTTALNEAYKTLKDPTRRAFYLLKLRGIDLDREEQGASSDEVKRLTTPPMEFLEEVITLREELSEAREKRDLAAAQKMGDEVTRRKKAALEEAAGALNVLEKRPDDAAELEKASRAMGRVRYFTRFLDEVEAIEEEHL